MKKSQVKGTDQQRGSSLKFQSPASLGDTGRTQGTAAHWQSCWPWAAQHTARLGCKPRGWGKGCQGLCRQWGSSTPWLPGDCRVCKEGLGTSLPPAVQQPAWTPDCCYSCLAGQENREELTHTSQCKLYYTQLL